MPPLDIDTIVGGAFAVLGGIGLLWSWLADRPDPDHATWACTVCHARCSSAEMLDAHLGVHRRPLMPGILCGCGHVGARHHDGDGPCVESCDCVGFTAAVSLRAVA